MRKIIPLIVLVVWVLASAYLAAQRPDAPTEFVQEHAALQGTWVLDNVQGANPDFYILHGFEDGRYVTSGSISSDDKGLYRIVSIGENGEFEIEMTSSLYGFTVDMNVRPQADRTLIKLDHQSFRRISDTLQKSR